MRISLSEIRKSLIGKYKICLFLYFFSFFFKSFRVLSGISNIRKSETRFFFRRLMSSVLFLAHDVQRGHTPSANCFIFSKNVRFFPFFMKAFPYPKCFCPRLQMYCNLFTAYCGCWIYPFHFLF